MTSVPKTCALDFVIHAKSSIEDEDEDEDEDKDEDAGVTMLHRSLCSIFLTAWHC
jgi:hypothetical protein